MKYQIKERADKKLSLIPKGKAKLAVYFTEKMLTYKMRFSGSSK